MTSIIDRATRVGRYAAELEAGGGTSLADNAHHVGDDTGDLISEAYKAQGAGLAADVIDAYLDAFNEGRAQRDAAPLSPADAIANLQWAIKPQGIDDQAQAKVRTAFKQRHP